MVRRLLLAAVLCALAGGFGAARANAALTYRPVLPGYLASPHFAVHYESDVTKSEYTTETQAGDLLAFLEQAYTSLTALGWQAPIDDSVTTPGLVDIYIEDLSASKVDSAVSIDGAGAPTSGTGNINVKALDGSAHEAALAGAVVAEIMEMRYWWPANTDDWAWYGSAEWAGAKAAGYPGSEIADLGPPNVTLDCADPVPSPDQQCSKIGFEARGLSRWTFFEYLAQKFGPTFVISMYQQQQSSGSSALAALQTVLAGKGTTLDQVFHDWSVRQMAGGWGIAGLDALSPPTVGTFAGGTITGSLGSQQFSVDHLANRYITFTRGDGDGSHPCFAATLTVTVTMPSGVNARPVLYWNVPGTAPVELTANGSTATTTVPWDTCFWSTNKAFLSLSNPSSTLNGQWYTVSASVTVDPNTPATATKAPDGTTGAAVYGGVTSVDSAAVPPSITLLAPQTIKLTAASPNIKLVAQSNGDGSLHATLGSVDLGTQAVRAGSNVVLFSVPKSLLTTLRRSAAVGNVLTLTPLSPSGAVAGTVMTRQVVIQAPAKAKAKPAPKKTKKTHKTKKK